MTNALHTYVDCVTHSISVKIYGRWINIRCMIWYDMIWYDIWYDMIWYDMIWYDMIWYDMIYDVMWCDVMWYDMIWYDMIWYDMIWYDMIWYDMMILIHLNCNKNHDGARLVFVRCLVKILTSLPKFLAGTVWFCCVNPGTWWDITIRQFSSISLLTIHMHCIISCT
jgi:hypothetical protein